MTELKCDADGLTESRLERLVFREVVDGDRFQLTSKASSIVTGDGDTTGQAEISSDHPLPDGLEGDVEKLFGPKISKVLSEMDGVAKLVCHFVYVKEDHPGYAVDQPLAFLEAVEGTTREGDCRPMSTFELVRFANSLGIDTPEVWMPPPVGLLDAILNDAPDRLEEWKKRMRYAPTKFGSVDYEKDVIAVVGKWKKEEDKEVQWSL